MKFPLACKSGAPFAPQFAAPHPTPPNIENTTAESKASMILCKRDFDVLTPREKEEVVAEAEHHIMAGLVPLVNSNAMVDTSVQEKGSSLWKALRRHIVCGTDVAVILGLDERSSRKQLHEDKFGEQPRVQKVSDVGQRMMDFGSVSEASALRLCRDLFPFPVIDVGRLRYKDDLSLEGTPDGATVGLGNRWLPIEVKTRAYPNPYDAMPYETKFDVPLKHWIQLTVYMMLLDANEGFLCSFTYNHGVRFFHLDLNRELATQHILPRIAEFRSHTLPLRVMAAERGPLNLLLTEMVVRHGVTEMSVEEVAACSRGLFIEIPH